MNDRLEDLDTIRFTRPTHQVTNQPPPLVGYNAWSGDAILRDAVQRSGGAWIAGRADDLGELVGSERLQMLASQANRVAPQLRTHDAFGHRIDEIEYHPAYHELMTLALANGLHSTAWTAGRSGGFVARAALNYLWNQGENGTSCPITMTFAAVQVLRSTPALAKAWEPKLTADHYDPRLVPVPDKLGAMIGMAMTEKQGGSDLRSTQTRARRLSADWFELRGHKWFCSAPMSDGFLTLALADGAITCFLVPRVMPDGQRNRFLIQRLKDKVGNRSNASAEIEYDGTLAQLVGEPGRGIATILEMAHLTRFDIVVAVAGMMRAALNQALHHCAHRVAFGRELDQQPLMQNVLADLAIEAEAATLLAFRLARAFDRQNEDEHERLLTRILTPVAKFWLCKRLPMFVGEAMECIGGNGYVDEHPIARLYREAPVNGIWEGSGNVICLDVLRAMQKTPDAREALFRELGPAIAADGRVSRYLDVIGTELGNAQGLEGRARRITELLAQVLSAALLVQHSTKEVVDAFCTARLGRDGGKSFGTLPGRVEVDKILERARIRS
ncbi:MAG TPA: acyl-CoA dehydrogenase family protein [Burkholderiales bacterium]|nr:acyl-CoA dehydrogenase family protein [Burkholderiales bacterium]